MTASIPTSIIRPLRPLLIETEVTADDPATIVEDHAQKFAFDTVQFILGGEYFENLSGFVCEGVYFFHFIEEEDTPYGPNVDIHQIETESAD